MNQKDKQNELLPAVFAEAVPEDFRRVVLGETLRHVRRQRQRRQVARVIMLLAVLGMFAIFARPYWPQSAAILAVKPSVKAPSNYQLVRTKPLPTAAMVTTQPLALAQIITSAKTGNIVRTSRGNYHMLNDDELLALISPRPAALIRLDKTSERLVFADPADEKNFLIP